jgi:hypothetical protein
MFEAWLVALGINLLVLVAVMVGISIVQRRSATGAAENRPTPSIEGTPEGETRTPKAA